MTGPAIEAVDLAKRYEPAGVEALRGVSFSVAEEEIFGFLGRNGAGKSTTVRILTTLLRPTSGSASVLGLDVVARAGEVRRSIGVALQDAALDELMTGVEHLVLAGRLAGMNPARARARADELLEALGLTGAAGRVAARYSGGMRRRLDLAMALVREPPILFLDEPTTGLDPQSRRALWELIRAQRDAGATVFLTTQYLMEADELADRVAIVGGGQIAAVGSPSELKGRFGATAIQVRLAASTPAERVREVAQVDEVEQMPDGWHAFIVPDGEAGVPSVMARLTAAGLSISRLRVLPPSLEDVFVTLTGDELAVETGTASDVSVAAIRRGTGVAPRARR